MVAILELLEVSKAYKGNAPVLSEVSCTIPEGMCTVLLGSNGAGKTTMFRLILGLLKPDRGQVLFRGKALTNSERAHLGYMPETSKLPLSLNTEQLFCLQAGLYGKGSQARSLVPQHLQALGLWEWRKKRLAQLSKGQARRVAWGIATLHGPELLILDEPFSGLDVEGRTELQVRLAELQKQRKTVLLTTHDVSYVAALQAHFLELQDGRLTGRKHAHPSARPGDRHPTSSG